MSIDGLGHKNIPNRAGVPVDRYLAFVTSASGPSPFRHMEQKPREFRLFPTPCALPPDDRIELRRTGRWPGLLAGQRRLPKSRPCRRIFSIGSLAQPEVDRAGAVPGCSSPADRKMPPANLRTAFFAGTGRGALGCRWRPPSPKFWCRPKDHLPLYRKA
jgi:hypothetical protein